MGNGKGKASEDDRSVYLPREWHNGVVLREAREAKANPKYKVTKSGVVIDGLKNIGVEPISDQKLLVELKKVAEGVPAE